MQFDMNRTWSQAVAKVRANFQLLALIAGLFMLLPSLVLVVASPQLFGAAMPGGDPEAAAQRLLGTGFLGVFSLVMLCALVGYSAMVALVGPARPTVGAAIGQGLKTLPTLIGTLLLFLVGYFLAAFVVGLVAGLLAVAVGAVAGPGAAVFLMIVLMALAVGYLLARFSLLLPVIVIEGTLNPFTAYIRSWRLTRPAHWRIFAFFMLLFVAYMAIAVLLLAIGSGIGLAAGGNGGTFFFGILSGLLGMIIAMVVSGILVSMHDQLAGTSSREIAETFE